MKQQMDKDKKIILIISPHSFIDVITNSSTELFVMDTNKSIEVVKEILIEAINLHNKVENTNYSFEDIFDEPYIGSGYDALDGWNDYYSTTIGNGIIIKSANDNSIPYWMFEFIESSFGDVERFHLG